MTPKTIVPPVVGFIGRTAGGESLHIWSFFALVSVVVLAVGAVGTVMIPLQRDAVGAVAERELEARARLLAGLVAPLIAEDRQGEARMLLTAAAQEGELTHARIVGANGEIIAASLAAPADSGLEGSANEVVARAPLERTQHGQAKLELAAYAPIGAWLGWYSQALMAGMLVAGLGGFLLAARRLRLRVRVLRAVGGALLSMENGEQVSAALAVDNRFGREAVAWNRLLEEREQLRQDLTRERTRDSLQSRTDRRGDLGQACDALWQGMLLVDEHLNVKYANGAAAVFLRTKKEIMNAPATAAVAQFIFDECVLEAIRSVASGEMRRRTTHEVRRPESEGGGILRFNVRPVRRDDAAAALIIIEDITQQRIADEARNAFVAQVTHELRTPLTNIRLYVEQAIEEGENDPAAVAQALNIINQESRRLERIVGDMLSVSEIEAGSFKLRTAEVRLDALFEELEADYKPQAEAKNLELAFELPPKLPVIRGDRDKIVLAMHNLIGNALKYTPEGGKVDVRVDVVDGRLCVEVVDTGIGIRPEESELIFDKFYRARDARVSSITGTGLGLALAREVVRLHGGDISVRSQIDRGSTFTMSLPTLALAA